MRLIHFLFEEEEEKKKDKEEGEEEDSKKEEEPKDSKEGEGEGNEEGDIKDEMAALEELDDQPTSEEKLAEMERLLKMLKIATMESQVNMAVQQVAMRFIQYGEEWKGAFDEHLKNLVSPRLHRDFMRVSQNFAKTLRHVKGPDGKSQEEKDEVEREKKKKEEEAEAKKTHKPETDYGKKLAKLNAELGKNKNKDKEED